MADPKRGSTLPQPPSIVAVAAGQPLDRLAGSGHYYHLFNALSEAGALAGAVSARPAAVHYLERIGGLSRDPEVGRQRYDSSTTRLSPLSRRTMSVVGGVRARRVSGRPDALMQIGAWYSFERMPRLKPRLRLSYHDGNLAVFLRRSDLALDRQSRSIRRALDYERRVYDTMDVIMPRSEWLRRSFIEDFGQAPDKVVAIGAGANIDRVPAAPTRDFARPRLLFIGRDFNRKGGPHVLRAFARVQAERPDAELWVVGPSSPLPPQAGVRHFGLIRRDTPEGDSRLARLYSEATTFVMPSIFEPWGTVFLEAMAYRLPCVGGKSSAMPELVDEGRTGFLVSPGDVDELAERMLTLVNNPGLARTMGEAGHRRFLERFTWERVAERITNEVTRRLDDRPSSF